MQRQSHCFMLGVSLQPDATMSSFVTASTDMLAIVADPLCIAGLCVDRCEPLPAWRVEHECVSCAPDRPTPLAASRRRPGWCSAGHRWFWV